jgi:NADH-quinone oxidoreductase subunit J
MSLAVFLPLSALLIASALGVVLSRSPVRSALSLVVTLFLLAVLFVFLDAHLVAALQIVVYAGAIMVLFLFVIMLLNLQEEPGERPPAPARVAAWGAGSLVVLVILLTLRAAGTNLSGPGIEREPSETFGTTAALSERLFTHFLLPFEITSVLLLVAIVGAVVIAKRKLD